MLLINLSGEAKIYSGIL